MEITTAELIKSARENATYEVDEREGGNATLVTLDADLFGTIMERLHKHATGG